MQITEVYSCSNILGLLTDSSIREIITERERTLIKFSRNNINYLDSLRLNSEEQIRFESKIAQMIEQQKKK